MAIWSFLTENWASIVAGAIASIPTAAISMWAFGSKLTEKWLDRRFQESLQRLKHEQDLTIARLKVEVDSVLAAKVKIQSKEFEVMAMAWEMMSDVMVKTSSAESPLRIQSDMSYLTDDDWEEVFEKQKISGGPRRDILAAKPTDRNRLYWNLIERIEVFDANRAISEFRVFIKKFGVFIHKDIGDEMESLALLAKSIMIKKSMSGQAEYRSILEDFEKFDKQFMPRYDVLFSLLRERLTAVGRMS